MGDFVGVDPAKVRILANRLKDLEGALAKHGPTIRIKFDAWDGKLDLSRIKQQTAQVGDDAKNMSKRADLAHELNAQPHFSSPGNNMINIPWDMADVNKQSATEAAQEAKQLQQANQNPKEPWARDTIKAIGQSLQDHKDDPAYLKAFADAGGIAAAGQTAKALHDEDGTHDGKVLSDDSTKILAQYGDGVNAIFAAQKAGRIPPNADYEKGLTNPPDGDMVSVGLLFKYGPNGKDWDPKVLSDVGGALLDWRAKQKTMRPSYAPGQTTMAGYAPGGYAGKDDGGWYHDWGLNPDYLNQNAEDQANTVAGIRAADPSLALMTRVGQNADASRDLLTAPDGAGLRHAQQLTDYRWETPGPIPQDDSHDVRRVLTLAATDRSAAHIDQSGQAAANILKAAGSKDGAMDTFSKRDDGARDMYPKYPAGTAMALADITGTWARDLGGTSMSAEGGATGYDPKTQRLSATQDVLDSEMQLFLKDNPTAAAAFDDSLNHQLADPGNKPSDFTYLGNTAGLVTDAKSHTHWTDAMLEDEKAKTNLFWANTVAGLAGGVPGPSAEGAEGIAKGLAYSQMLISGGRAELTDQFDTGHASRQEIKNRKDATTQYHRFQPAIATSLIRSGTLTPPDGVDWYDPKTKSIKPDAVGQTDFNTWWSKQRTNSDAADTLGHFQDGFTSDPSRNFDGENDGPH